MQTTPKEQEHKIERLILKVVKDDKTFSYKSSSGTLPQPEYVDLPINAEKKRKEKNCI